MNINDHGLKKGPDKKKGAGYNFPKVGSKFRSILLKIVSGPFFFIRPLFLWGLAVSLAEVRGFTPGILPSAPFGGRLPLVDVQICS
jgi:hypothetical protein